MTAGGRSNILDPARRCRLASDERMYKECIYFPLLYDMFLFFSFWLVHMYDICLTVVALMFFARGVPRQQKDREDLADGVTATLAYVCPLHFPQHFFKGLLDNAK